MLYYNINYVRVVKLDLGASDNMMIFLDVHVHPFAPGGYEIAQADDFWHTRHMMLGYFIATGGAIRPYGWGRIYAI